MSQDFNISLIGELTFLLVLQIQESNDEIIISWTKYMQDILKRFNIKNSKDIDNDGESFNQMAGINMIESLLYLTTIRPNIIFNISFCARF